MKNNLFRIIPHYSALFRIILAVLTVINVESSNGQTGSNNSSDSDALTISLYSGIEDVNLGGLTGVGVEWMFRNISANFGVGRGIDYMGTSMGIKVYDSDTNSKNRIFGGINYITYDSDYCYYPTYNDIAITAGYRYTTNCGIYLSPYAGIKLINVPTCFGLNIGYQFNPIHLK